MAEGLGLALSGCHSWVRVMRAGFEKLRPKPGFVHALGHIPRLLCDSRRFFPARAWSLFRLPRHRMVRGSSSQD